MEPQWVHGPQAAKERHDRAMRQALLLLRWRGDLEKIAARKRERFEPRWDRDVADGLIVAADLERALPEQIVFRGRVFRRAPIAQWFTGESRG
jgi:hypothetical protein